METNTPSSAAPSEPAAAPQQTPRVRGLLWAAPYGLVVLAAAFVHPLVALTSVAVSAVVYAAYERLHPTTLWRYPAGWLLSLLLLVPSLYVIGYSTPWPVLLMALPGLLLWAVDRLSRGAVARLWRPQPLYGTLLYPLLVAGLMFTTRGCGMPPPTDDVLFQVYAAPQPEPLDQPSMDQAVRLVDRALREYRRDENEAVDAVGATRASDVARSLRRVTGRDAWVTLWLPG
ncbi:MAG: hypothetical protein JRI23_31350 [Deltaproteobacteria bacterium]|jgi:hypothetical protein|nr:hypothetical protein [Deltaproteobacteria bacterium]MBW2536706.1 hypothetical protein [Deltaproteobacteria bacterium]